MDRIMKKLIRVFNGAVVLVPLAMAAVFGLVYLFGGWGGIMEGHDPAFYDLEPISSVWRSVLLALLWLLTAALFAALLLKLRGRVRGAARGKLFVFAAILLLALGIRLAFLYLYYRDLWPFSDFYAAWYRAMGDTLNGQFDHYTLFPAYMTFSFYEELVIRFFGMRYAMVLCLCALYSALTAGILYLTGCEISSRESVGVLAGLLYAFYPSNILFTAVGAPDYITMLFNALGAYLLLLTLKNGERKKQLLTAILGGLSLGVGCAFKQYAVVIVIAFFMVVLARQLVEQPGRFPAFLSALLLSLVVFAGYKAASGGILALTSRYYGVRLDGSSPVPHFLLVGLNTQGEGQIGRGSLSRLYYEKYLAAGMDLESAKSYAFALLKEDWALHPDRIVPNLARKLIWAWQDDQMPVYFFLHKVNAVPVTPMQTAVYDFVADFGAELTQGIYVLLTLFAVLGAALRVRGEIDFRYEFTALPIFGYFCMILLSEGQSRYKCLVMGYLILVASLGMQAAADALRGRRDARPR